MLSSHLILPDATSIALSEPEAWFSISVNELPQYGCPLMKKAIGMLGKCLSELDIKRRRLTVLS